MYIYMIEQQFIKNRQFKIFFNINLNYELPHQYLHIREIWFSVGTWLFC